MTPWNWERIFSEVLKMSFSLNLNNFLWGFPRGDFNILYRCHSILCNFLIIYQDFSFRCHGQWVIYKLNHARGSKNDF